MNRKTLINIPALLLLTILLAGCRNKSMTLEELKTANWTRLDTAIDYISLENGKSRQPDSIHYSVKGFIGGDIMALAELDGHGGLVPDSLIDVLIHSQLSQSRHGYLRFNIYEMAQKSTLTATVYLRDSYDTARLEQDMQLIRQLPGITEVAYISKDSAAKKYLADGNSDWSKVLKENPLPSSIDIVFDRKVINPERYPEMGKTLRDNIPDIGDIQFPENLFEKWKGSYLVMEYKRD